MSSRNGWIVKARFDGLARVRREPDGVFPPDDKFPIGEEPSCLRRTVAMNISCSTAPYENSAHEKSPTCGEKQAGLGVSERRFG